MSAAAHLVLALILTGVLACQAKVLLAVLRCRRVPAVKRSRCVTELAWIAIPVVVVLFLTARSWMVALAPGSSPVVSVTLLDVSLLGGASGRDRSNELRLGTSVFSPSAESPQPEIGGSER